MNVILAFLAIVLVLAGWWLSRQQLFAKPWLETGLTVAAPEAMTTAPAKLGVGFFLAVVGGLFAMLGSAFVMQIEETPAQLAPLPRVVWLNTALLLLSSVGLQTAVTAARRGDTGRTHRSMAAAGIAAIAFLAGQVLAGQILTEGGYGLNDGPAASFFYLITGLHGVHILGGLAAMGVVWARISSRAAAQKQRAAIALCAFYWHGLLVVWLVLFALLTGWANDILALCRAVLS